MKKRYILPFVILLLCSVSLFAQPNGERVEAMKIAYITNKLELTPSEAQAFWPVYNKHQDEVKKLRMDRAMERMNARTGWEEMSDKEVEETLNRFIALKESEVQLQKQFYADLKKVLPIRKVGLLFKAEEDFKKAILEAIKERRQQGGVRPGMNGR